MIKNGKVRFFCACGREMWTGLTRTQKETMTIAEAEGTLVCSDCLLHDCREYDAANKLANRLRELGYVGADVVEVGERYLVEIQQNGFNYHLSERHVNQLLNYPGPHPIQLVDYYGVYYWYKEEDSE